MATYPTQSLQPGSTGPAVKQLQDYLVSQGYMTQAQVNTGYGNYGPQTTAAVKALQQKLGVDNSSGPGYWGPRTLAKVQAGGTDGTTPPENPPADNPPADNPPADNPPADNPPADNPPAIGGTTGGALSDTSWLNTDSDYLNLSADLQDYLKKYYSILGMDDKESQQRLLSALTESIKEADPYFAEIINIAKENLEQNLKGLQGDYDYQEKTLQENINRIKNDLATKKGDLSIDQQAELARQAKNYELNLDSLRENAANSGLTFSTKRAQAETNLATSNTDIVESTQRKYMREARDLELGASRDEADSLAKIAEYKRRLGEQQMSSLRKTEEYLGTSGLPSLPGLTERATPIGGVTGSLYEDRIKDIWARAEGLAGLNARQNPFI